MFGLKVFVIIFRLLEQYKHTAHYALAQVLYTTTSGGICDNTTCHKAPV